MSNVRVFIQDQLVITVSAPSLRNRARGRRLVKKASFTAVFTWERAQVGSGGRGARVVSTGNVRRKKIVIKLDVITSEVGCIAATWICTKSFWFLRPTDELLSFRSGSSEPRGSTKVVEISSFRC